MMGVDWGIIATYLSLLAAAFAFLLGAIYKMGKLASTFELHVRKISEWEGAIQNLNAIPDLKTSIAGLAQRVEKQEERASSQFEKHASYIADLRDRVSQLQGRMDLHTLRANLDEET